MLHYETNCDQYVLVDQQGDEQTALMDEISIAFSIDTIAGMHILHKHGATENVKQWADKAIERYRNAGFDDMANEIRVVTGKFDVDQLNRVLDTTGYISRFLAFHGISLENVTLSPKM